MVSLAGVKPIGGDVWSELACKGFRELTRGLLVGRLIGSHPLAFELTVATEQRVGCRW